MVDERRAIVTWAALAVPFGVRRETTAEVVFRATAASQALMTGDHAVPSTELLIAAAGQSLATHAGQIEQVTLQSLAHVAATGLMGAISVVDLRALGALDAGLTIAGRQGPVLLRGEALAEIIGVRYILPRIPMQQLAPVDLGTTYRGDTMILPIWAALTREGEPYDLEEGILYFTAKQDLVLPDEAPHVIQCSSEDGGITKLNPPLGHCYRVRIEPDETHSLEGDTVFTFDVQLHTDTANVYTIRRGLLTVVRDVTRALS